MPFSAGVWPLEFHVFGPFDVTHVSDFCGQDVEIEWQVITRANRASAITRGDDSSCAAGNGIYRP